MSAHNRCDYMIEEIAHGFHEILVDWEREEMDRFLELYGPDEDGCYPGQCDDGYDEWVAAEDAAYDVFDDAEEWLAKQDVPNHLWYDSDVF